MMWISVNVIIIVDDDDKIMLISFSSEKKDARGLGYGDDGHIHS